MHHIRHFTINEIRMELLIPLVIGCVLLFVLGRYIDRQERAMFDKMNKQHEAQRKAAWHQSWRKFFCRLRSKGD